MRLQQVFSCAVGGGISNLGIFVLVALLACLLAAEIACICILIKKILGANKVQEADDDQEDTYLGGGAMMLAPLGAIPGIAYFSLSGLAIACAVAGVVLIALLIYARVNGYRISFDGENRFKEQSMDDQTASELPAEETTDEDDKLEDYDYNAADDEVQMQETYTEPQETVGAVDASEEAAEETEVTEVVTSEETILPAEAVASTEGGVVAPVDPTQPYKVVEKVVTETYKEVIKEAPAPAPSASAPADALLEKLSDFLDYEMQKRKEADSIDAMAPVIEPDDGDDEDEVDGDDDDMIDPDDPRDENDVDDADADHFTGNERIIGFDEETGCYIVAHYRKSFEAKLIQARPHIKKYYSELKNALLAYKGSKNRISWSADSFHNGRQPIAKINVKTRILEIYLALDPASLEGTVYRGKDVGDKKKYADTPFQYKVRTPRKFKWAMELVQRTCEEHGLSPIDIEPVDYEAEYPFDTTENLVARNLIKEYIRQEKPATSFELAPDHTPSLPEEDGSVIPANANFLWEFDNERMGNHEEEPPAPEETPEEAPAPESVAEAPTEEAPVVRETVKITEMRSTERYYTNQEPTYDQVITTTEPIPVSELTESTEDAVEDEQPDTNAEEPTVTEPVFEDEQEDELFFADDEATPDAEEALDVAEDAGEEAEDIVFEEEEEAEDEEEAPAPAVTVAPTSSTVAKVDLCAIEAYYAEGEIVNLQSLKDRGLIEQEAQTLRVHASGSLGKALTVEANHFNMDAIVAISASGGESTMIR